MDLIVEQVKMLTGEIAFSTSTLKSLVEQSVNDPESSKTQNVMKLMAQYSEQGLELEIKSADNCILQEQLENKCAENMELQEKILHLEQQLASVSCAKMPSPPDNCVSDEYADELRNKMPSQSLDENKSLILKIVENQNSGKLRECAK